MAGNNVEGVYVPFNRYEFTDYTLPTPNCHPFQTDSPQKTNDKDLEFNHKKPEDFSSQSVSNKKKKRKREPSPKPSRQSSDEGVSHESNNPSSSSIPGQPFMTQSHDDITQSDDESTTNVSQAGSTNGSRKKRGKDIRYQKKQKALRDRMAELVNLPGGSKAEVMELICKELISLREENKKLKSLMGREIIQKKDELEQKNLRLKSENEEQKQKIEELNYVMATETGIIGTMFDLWTDLMPMH